MTRLGEGKMNNPPLDDLFELRIGDRVVALGSEGLAGLRGEPAAVNAP